MAIELAPITRSGNAHRFHPLTSTSAKKAARIRTTSPPLYSVYDDVQIRLTMGLMCSHWSTRPASVSAMPATRSPFNFSFSERDVFNHMPDHRPSIMVASVGMKLRVDQPPSLKRNGSSRGNRFRNHTSNAHERFEFLLKCARKPV